jgi:membrane associated rhomboid family serine protease
LRLLTHPFVHVSGYHFLLDAAAFLALWSAIGGRVQRRVACMLCAVAGALAASLAWSEVIWHVGLCGLSGAAHGLMLCGLLDALKMSRSGQVRVTLGVGLSALIIKVAYELFAGQLAWSGWHPGDLGTPILECHLGGLLGAAGFWLAEQFHRSRQPRVCAIGRSPAGSSKGQHRQPDRARNSD